MAPTKFQYSVFGLRLQSDLQLPELLEADASSRSQVTVRVGKVPDAPAPGPGPHPTDGGLLLVIDEVACYFVKDGSEIIVEPEPDVPDANVRLFLLGSAMGALLHQRGLLPLHANAVEVEGRAYAFMGESGAGKSTMAAWFHDRGFRIVADDVCVVDFADGARAQIRPGISRLRLWRDTLDATGRDAADHQRSFFGDDAPDKYDVPLARPCSTDEAIPLAAVYLLERGESLAIEPLTGLVAAEAIFANTYRGAYVPLTRSSHDHWSASVKLVRNTPVFCAKRRWGLEDLAEQYSALLEHALQVRRP
ncbi:hypothetical protein [Sphingomonas sp.]|uniref:hypothetical protein n=1 Tax=Sphingomonas sp. TaxID=28214 RepID=UPI001797396D|nr:hypothetical protein [Sphingomonas sp.]MBA3512360.1 hypothetical protein [Sphingomonas sp.]